MNHSNTGRLSVFAMFVIVIAVLIAGALLFVGSDDSPGGAAANADIEDADVLKDGEMEDKTVTVGVTAEWLEEEQQAVIETPNPTGIDAVEARGNVIGEHRMKPDIGSEMRLDCADLDGDTGVIKITAVDGNRVNVITTLEYECH